MQQQRKGNDLRISLWDRIVELLRNHRIHKGWLKVIFAMACVVTFVTTYILIMPAITLSKAPDCGLEEHSHTDACYETRTELTCSQEEHSHTDACYDEEGNLVCPLEEHRHSESCYTSETVLVCGMEEHIHTDDCYPAGKAEEKPAEDIPEDQSLAEARAYGSTEGQLEFEGKDYKITFTLIRRIEGGEWETVQPEQKVVLPVYGENDKLIWTDVFSNLPRKDENGNAYEYDVTEDNVPGYEEQTHEFIPSGSTTPIREKEEIGEYWAPVTDNPLRSDRNYAIVHGDQAIAIDPDRTDDNGGAKGTFTKLENITRVEGNFVNDADRQFDHYFVKIP